MVPLKCSPCHLNLSQSQRSLWQIEGRRKGHCWKADIKRLYLCEKEGEKGKVKLKAKDYLCFSCTGVRFFTRFDANVSFSMLHVSFLF